MRTLPITPARNSGRLKLSRRERDKIKRQEEIIQAALVVFARKGYHDTRLDEIAHQAELGKGTIYNYFSSKEELFLGIIDKLTSEMVQLARTTVNRTGGDAREKFTAYARSMLLYFQNHREIHNLVLREIHRLHSTPYRLRLQTIRTAFRKMWAILAKPLALEIRAGKIKSNDPFKIAALFDSMIRLYAIRPFENKKLLKTEEIDDTVTMVIATFFDGITERN